MQTKGLESGTIRAIHHIAFNVKDMKTSVDFYGRILGLHQLQGEEIPSSLQELVAAGKVANFITSNGIVIDLFAEPDLSPPAEDPTEQFTRANHLAFDIPPEMFEQVVEILKQNRVRLAGEPVSRSTGRGIYFYDPDGFLLEIRCNPA